MGRSKAAPNELDKVNVHIHNLLKLNVKTFEKKRNKYKSTITSVTFFAYFL